VGCGTREGRRLQASLGLLTNHFGEKGGGEITLEIKRRTPIVGAFPKRESGTGSRGKEARSPGIAHSILFIFHSNQVAMAVGGKVSGYKKGRGSWDEGGWQRRLCHSTVAPLRHEKRRAGGEVEFLLSRYSKFSEKSLSRCF